MPVKLPEDKLTAKQKKAVEALVEGKNYRETALVVGITDRTLAKWRETPLFQQELRNRTANALHHASYRLTTVLDSAIDVLITVMEDESAPHSVRVRSALGIFDKVLSMWEVTEILERLDEIEARLHVK